MTVTLSPRRVAATALGSAVLLAGATIPAWADAPTKGDIKVTGPAGVVPGIGHKPKIGGCEVIVEIHGYTVDNNGKATVEFHANDQQTGVTWVGHDTIQLTNTSQGNNQNGTGQYSFQTDNLVRGEDGYLLTVTVGGDIKPAETREFWLDCAPVSATRATQGPDSRGGSGGGDVTMTGNTGDSSSSGKADEAKSPKKVNSGGTADASGLVFLGVAGIGLAAAAGFGLRKRKQG